MEPPAHLGDLKHVHEAAGPEGCVKDMFSSQVQSYPRKACAMNMPPTRGLGTVHESHKFNIRRSSVLFKCKTTTLNCVASSCSRLYLGPIQVNQ